MLSEEGLGCHLHGQFVGAFIYADDVTFVTLTNTVLNVKLETCSNFVTYSLILAKLNVYIFLKLTKINMIAFVL